MGLQGSRILLRGKDSFDHMVGPASAWVEAMPQYTKRVELRIVTVITTIYKGWALPGTAEATAEWMIEEIVLDETTGLDVSNKLAGGNPADGQDPFKFTWNGRAGHSYS